jgi:HEAT repeat protein
MRALTVAACSLLGFVACESATSERIEAWKGTQKGPDRIEGALRSSNVPANLRAEAAVALVDIGKPEKVDEIMAALEAGERWEILKTLVDIDIKGMASPQLPKARDARDTLFSVRQYAPPEEQKRIDTALLASIEKDLSEGRFSGGRHSLDKLLTAIGPPSGPMLVRLLGDAKAPYKGLAELLVKVCDEATRDKGGAALLGRISAGKPIPNDMWLALGMLGGPTVTDFLSTKVQKGPPEEAIAAAKALQQARYPSVLQMALKIAGDGKANKELRDEAFGVVEKIGGPEAQKGLLRIIAEDKKDIVRYRAHEAALEVGKADAIVPALQAFSGKLSFKREDVIDFLVKDISKVGAQAKPAVLAALASPSPLARMTAVLALEAPLPTNAKARLGAAADAGALGKLEGDKATIKGFPAGMTVGSEAKRVVLLLQGKGGS